LMDRCVRVGKLVRLLLKNSRASLESGRQPEDKKSSGGALRDTRELSRLYTSNPLLTHRSSVQCKVSRI
jgi:hypothetical protein